MADSELSDTVSYGTQAAEWQSFRLGTVQVLPRERKLTVGGEVHKLEPKVLDVLLCLAERPREVVSRGELLERVWPRSDVSDEVLSRCVYQLRRLLGDSSSQPRFIETVPKSGYRLLVAPSAAVAEASDVPDPTWQKVNRPAVWALLTAGLFVVLGTWLAVELRGREVPLQVAVQPIAAPAGSPALQLLAMTLNDGIHGALAEGHDDTVQFDWLVNPPGGETALSEAGPQYLVNGRLEAVQGESRALLHLFIESLSDGRRVTTPLNVFEVPYVADGTDVATLNRFRTAIAERMLLYLGVELPYVHNNLDALEREAFRLLMYADWELYSGKDCGIGAQSLLERSVELNPDSARAWAQLAESYWHQVWDCNRGPELLGKAEQALTRAARLDPTQPYGVSVQQELLLQTGRVEEAYAAILEHAERAPDDVYVRYAQMQALVSAGFIDVAVDVLARIDAIDPLALSAELVDAPMPLLYAGRLDEFVTLAPIKPIPRILYYRALAEWQRGNVAETRRLIALGVDVGRPPSAFTPYLRTLDAVAGGEPSRAVSTLERDLVSRRERGGEAAFRIAQLLALAGDGERAGKFAVDAVQGGFFCPKCLALAPGISEIVTDPGVTRAMEAAVERHRRFARRFGMAPELAWQRGDRSAR